MKIFYHSADLDGHCSGALVKEAYPEAELCPINYGDKFPWDEIQSDEIVFMVDFSLEPITLMWALNDKCKQLVWIDHHKSAIESYIDAFRARDDKQGLSGVRVVGKAACELTWEYLYPDKALPEFIKLLGRYDAWDHSDPDKWEQEILPFQMGMRLTETDPNKNPWAWAFTWKSIALGDEKRIIDINICNGKTIIAYQKQQNAAYMQSHAYECTWEGQRCILINSGKENSQTFESMYDPAKHDLMIAYSNVKGQYWTVSLYSETVDCSEIAKKYHGGGHKGAAGFACKTLPTEWIDAQ
jgi:oligoribonuclease NrnB/cAMP/cGMP phosphodiesterase (DHH superfamily)